LSAVRTLVTSARFQDGVVVALCATAAAAFWAMARRARRPTSLAGLAFVLAVLIAQALAQGLTGDHNAAAWLTFGIGVVAVGGAGYVTRDIRLNSSTLSGTRAAEIAAGLVLGIVGALLLTSYVGNPRAGWLRPVAILAIVVLAPLVADFEERFAGLGAAAILILVSACGIYVAVPDTERALVVLGVAAPVAVLTLLAPQMLLGRVGTCAIVGILVWAVTYGAAGRPITMVGALGCLGLLAAAPLGYLTARRGERRAPIRRIPGLVILVAVQVCLALYAAEVVARVHALAAATVLLVPVGLVGVIVGRLVAPWAGGTAAGVQAGGEEPG
jgi:hypothetical protein